MPECVHRVDFDKMEMVRDRKGKLKMRVSCEKCHTEVTLDGVFSNLVSKIASLNKRVRTLEGAQGDDNGEPVPGTES